ncbi:MAG: hypothetical protein QM768_02865 [Agriterribacter sp.]
MNLTDNKIEMMNTSEIISQPQLVKRFYFLDYFYILLESCEKFSNKEEVFSHFKVLKIINQLGESRYRRLTQDEESDLSVVQLRRFKYSFEQVIIESTNYGLLKEDRNELLLTDLGKEILSVGRSNKRKFDIKIFTLMEAKYFAFYQLIKHCYKTNKAKNGLLIFPIYSPLKLGFEKSQFKKNKAVFEYTEKLQKKLEQDIKEYLNTTISLKDALTTLNNTLISENLITSNLEEAFEIKNFNKITRRIRTYWLNFFLKNIYDYQYSFDAFNIWVERGKQIGILNSTEFYPNFDGRLVYPTSIIVKDAKNTDFTEIFSYVTEESLYLHLPTWEKVDSQMRKVNQDEFVQNLIEAYFDLRKSRGTHFIRLLDVREKVCYRMRIPNYLFDECLEKTYLMNIRGEMDAQISLEADRLPHETNAMYLKREPVLVHGKYKNIIAIDYKKQRL